MKHFVYVIRIMLVVLMLNMSASFAMAQAPALIPDEEGSLLTWAIGIGLIIVTGLTSFLNPKRTHMT